MARARTHTATPTSEDEEQEQEQRHHSVFEDRSVLNALWSAVVAAPTSVAPAQPVEEETTDADPPTAETPTQSVHLGPAVGSASVPTATAPPPPAAPPPTAPPPTRARPSAPRPSSAAPSAPPAPSAPTSGPPAAATSPAAPTESAVGSASVPSGLVDSASTTGSTAGFRGTAGPAAGTTAPPADKAAASPSGLLADPAPADTDDDLDVDASEPQTAASHRAANRTIWAGPRHAAPHEWTSLSAVLTVETPAAAGDIGLLVLRLIVGITMAAHGAQKAFGAFGGDGLSGTAHGFAQLGYQPGMLFALAAVVGELFGGILLTIGLLTPLAAGGIIGVTVNAMVAVNLGHGFFATHNGIELPLLLMAGALALLLAGPGRYAADARIPLFNGAAVQSAAAAIALFAMFSSLAAHVL